jgi:phage tail-like protein
MLERGVTHDIGFEDWANKISNFSGGRGSEASLTDFRKDVTVELYNEAGLLVLAYTIFRCWVSEYQVLLQPSASQDVVAFKSIKLENEGWERDHNVLEPPA